MMGDEPDEPMPTPPDAERDRGAPGDTASPSIGADRELREGPCDPNSGCPRARTGQQTLPYFSSMSSDRKGGWGGKGSPGCSSSCKVGGSFPSLSPSA